MPLPKVIYQVDKYHTGQFVVIKMVDGNPVEEVERFWDLQEAQNAALSEQTSYIINHLFPQEIGSEKLLKLSGATRLYFKALLELLPLENGDANQARLLVRQAYNFAKSAILLDGMV